MGKDAPRGGFMRPDYIIEASLAGEHFKRQTSFSNGDVSRWGEPFNLELAKKEAEGFKEVRRKDFKHVRLIVNI